MKINILTNLAHGDIICFAPPLVITEAQLHEACDVIERVILAF